MEACGVKVFVIATLYSVLLVTLTLADLGKQLNYFETLKETDIRSRTKRESRYPSIGIHEIWLNALGREFHLKLKNSKILSNEFKTTIVDGNGEERHLPLQQGQTFYSGILYGDADSIVNVYWEDRILTASIISQEDFYFIEPSWRFLPHSHNHSMVIYKQSDIKSTKHDSLSSFCNAKKTHQPDNERHNNQEAQNSSHVSLKHEREETGIYKRSSKVYSGHTVCKVHLVADYYFHKAVGGELEHTTRNYLISVMDRVNEIYKKTRWPDNKSSITGLGFEIAGIKIFKAYSPKGHYNMKDRPANIDTVIKAFSQNFNRNRHCLVHLFTFQGFPSGAYGLAYIASDRPHDLGGICSGSAYGTAFNTGVSTYSQSDGDRRLSLSAFLTVAHGHNWGSLHDADTSECSPSSSDGGKYIMFANAQNGYNKNNMEFSPCSQRFIYRVLQTKAYDCFQEPTAGQSLCGNGRRDRGEECDPGEATDYCCTKDCTLQPNAECSDLNYACCKQCKRAPKDTPCRSVVDDNVDCKDAAVCDGVNLSCPPSKNKPPATDCIDGGKCYDGVCVDYCGHLKLIPCVCSQESGYACYRCCRANINGSKCRNYEDLLQDGRPCYQGYCQKGQCLKTTTPGSRLWNIIEKTFSSSFAEFMRNNIVWTVSLMSLIIWVIGGIAVRCHDIKEKEEGDPDFTRLTAERHMSVLPKDEPYIEDHFSLRRQRTRGGSEVVIRRRQPRNSRNGPQVSRRDQVRFDPTIDNSRYRGGHETRGYSNPQYSTGQERTGHFDELAPAYHNPSYINDGRNNRYHGNDRHLAYRYRTDTEPESVVESQV